MDIQGPIIDHWVEKMLDHLEKLPDVRFLSSEEREKYDESIKAVDDYYSGLYGSYVEGEKKGMAKGRAEGMAKGRAEGMAKGIAKGMAKEKLDTAYRLLSMGLSEAQVATATELPLEEIQKLKE